jgi:hypothetical protein
VLISLPHCMQIMWELCQHVYFSNSIERIILLVVYAKRFTLRHVLCKYFNMEKSNLRRTLSRPYSCIDNTILHKSPTNALYIF